MGLKEPRTESMQMQLNMPDKLCLLVHDLFFIHVSQQFPNHRAYIFANHISIKMTLLRYRYNNTLFIILFQQRGTFLLIKRYIKHLES